MCLLMGCMCLRVPFFYPDSASLPLWDTLFWHLSCQQRDSASRTSKHKANIYLITHMRERIYRATRLNVGRLTTLVKHPKSLSWPSRHQLGGEGSIPAAPLSQSTVLMRCHFPIFSLRILHFSVLVFFFLSLWATCSPWPNNPTSVCNFTFLILQISAVQTFSQLVFRGKWVYEKSEPRWHSCVRSELDLESLEHRTQPQREEG